MKCDIYLQLPISWRINKKILLSIVLEKEITYITFLIKLETLFRAIFYQRKFYTNKNSN